MARKSIDEQGLFDAALKEFSRYRYEDASINRIIEAAEITKGSFYYRYATKYDLYLDVLRRATRQKWEYIHERMTDADADLDLFELLLEQARLGAEFAGQNPDLAGLAARFSREKDSKVYARAMEDLDADDSSGIEQLVANAFESGQCSSEYSVEFVSRLIPTLLRMFDEQFFPGESYDAEVAQEYFRQLVRFIRAGLRG